jgi:hypothetical protein
MTKKKDNTEGVNNNFSKTKGDFIMSCVDLFAIKYETFEDSKFDKEQLEMLKMSEEDIVKGRLISQENLDKQDYKWLEGK